MTERVGKLGRGSRSVLLLFDWENIHVLRHLATPRFA